MTTRFYKDNSTGDLFAQLTIGRYTMTMHYCTEYKFWLAPFIETRGSAMATPGIEYSGIVGVKGFTVNWSCCGAVSADEARAFKRELSDAIQFTRDAQDFYDRVIHMHIDALEALATAQTEERKYARKDWDFMRNVAFELRRIRAWHKFDPADRKTQTHEYWTELGDWIANYMLTDDEASEAGALVDKLGFEVSAWFKEDK